MCDQRDSGVSNVTGTSAGFCRSGPGRDRDPADIRTTMSRVGDDHAHRFIFDASRSESVMAVTMPSENFSVP